MVDEAYIDFAGVPSAEVLLKELPNLVVAQTFSKWAGLAGVRIGKSSHPPNKILFES